MKKEELKEKLNGYVSFANNFKKGYPFRVRIGIVETKLPYGGCVQYFYDLTDNMIVIYYVNLDEAKGLECSIEEMPEILSDVLSEFDCDILEYKWLN